MVYWDVDGVVSVWLGNLPDEATFTKYIEERERHEDEYEASERTFASRFAEEFDIEHYDSCSFEAKFVKTGPVAVAKILAAFSGSSSYVDIVETAALSKGIEACNTAVLLFMFLYQQQVTKVAANGLMFIGTFPADVDAPFVETPVFD